MSQRTPLHSAHVDAGAKMVDFHGWEMPLHYGSQVDEHHAVRRDSGIFDVSHMTVIDIAGDAAESWLRSLVTNDPATLRPGAALYTPMTDEQGGILDDLIVYRRDGDWRLVVNSATRTKVLAWLNARAVAGVEMHERSELAMVAVQGPRAIERARDWLGDLAGAVDALPAFGFVETGQRFVARTGYTGESGFEAILPPDAAVQAWHALTDAGVQPAGLGARDTLRLEAGMNLYGQDMDETTSPLESNLAWTLAFEPEDRDFCGRDALQAQRAAGVARRLVGVVLQDRGVLRAGQVLRGDDRVIGVLTSGAFSPTLGRGIGLARIETGFKLADVDARVEIRGKQLPVRLVRPPFVRNGTSRVD